MGPYDIIARAIQWGVAGWLVLLAVLFAYRCTNGEINLNGLLARSAQQAADGLPSPERVQLLFAFLLAVAGYARLTLTTMHGAVAAASLPAVPTELMVLFVGSHGIYLAGKLGWMLNLKQFISKPGD
jgi:hypothetical protein